MSIVSKMLRCAVCYRWMVHLALIVVYIEFAWNYVCFNSNDYYFTRFTPLQRSPNYANKFLNYFAVGDSWIPVWCFYCGVWADEVLCDVCGFTVPVYLIVWCIGIEASVLSANVATSSTDVAASSANIVRRSMHQLPERQLPWCFTMFYVFHNVLLVVHNVLCVFQDVSLFCMFSESRNDQHRHLHYLQ